MAEERTASRTREGIRRLAARAEGIQGNGASVDAIRDIIFGGQMREYDTRFARLEARLLKQAAESKLELKRRLAALEDVTGREVQGIARGVRSERRQRAATVRKLGEGLASLEAASARNSAKVARAAEKAIAELKEQMRLQLRRFSRELERRVRRHTAEQRRQLANLRQHKLDRGALAAIFAEASERVGNRRAAKPKRGAKRSRRQAAKSARKQAAKPARRRARKATKRRAAPRAKPSAVTAASA